ncbi:bifunctional metallophosphatase/5'-nucleotidase, partial [Halomonas sp. SIMBA_159]
MIDVNGEEIGVVGATTPALASISSPGDVGVLPEDSTNIEALADLIQEEVDTLTEQGINKIILSSHFQQLAIEEEV